MLNNPIFVFGSNLAGRHGAGAALFAMKNHGAVYGCGEGRQGNSYAIPTKGHQIETLPLSQIAEHVKSFLDHAEYCPGTRFHVTPIGTGLAGYSISDIAPLFVGAPDNCIFRDEFGLDWRERA